MRLEFENGMPVASAKLVRVGAYVRVHPASNWFMRGVTGARVRKVGRKYLHLTATLGRGIGTNFKLPFRHVLEVTQ